MKLLLTFVIIGLVSLQCIDSLESYSFQKFCLWNFAKNSTARVLNYTEGKIKHLKNFFTNKKI